MKRADAKWGAGHKRKPSERRAAKPDTGREVQLPLGRAELLGLMQGSLEGPAVELGLPVASALPEDEVTRPCGAGHERRPDRTHARYGRQGGVVALGGQKLPVARPRARRADGGGAVALETYAEPRSPAAMPQAVLRRMVRGVSTREHEHVVDMARAGFGVGRPSVGRQFVRASSAAVRAPAERRFDGEHFAAIVTDGVGYAGETMVVALGTTEEGTKKVLGLRRGATGDAEVCAALPEGLRGRGLDTGRPTPFVLDGAKALRAVVTRVWGKGAVTRRCLIHKKRNMTSHVPEKHRPGLDRRPAGAYRGTDYATARASLEGTARWLGRVNPGAASSSREGLEEALTVVRLGAAGALRRTPATTDPIEGAPSVARRVTSRVTRWRDGDVRRRWCVAGLPRAEAKFRRVKGHREMPAPLKALEALVGERAAGNERDVA